VRKVEHLRSRHESGLLSRQVGCEVIMKLCLVDICETVWRFLYGARLSEVAWKALSIVSFILSSIWHVGRNVDQTGYRWIRPGFGNYRSAIAVGDQNARSILLSEHPLRSSDIFFKGCLWFLDDAHVVSILDKNVVNTLPAGTICPGTVDQNDIANAMLFVLR